jgi:hypothetical protein
MPASEKTFGGMDGIIAKIKENLNVPAYETSFKPFETGTESMNAITTVVTQITSDAQSAISKTTDLSSFLSSKCSDIPGLPTSLNFDISSIIDDTGVFRFDITKPKTGLCGLMTTPPTTLLGAVENIVNSIISGMIAGIVNFMDRINTTFTNPNKMSINLDTWFDETMTSINTAFKTKRENLMEQLREYKNEFKLTNDEANVEDIISKMNEITEIDNKIKELVPILRDLKISIVQLKTSFESASQTAMALSRNMPAIIGAWEKDATCIMSKMSGLFTRTS